MSEPRPFYPGIQALRAVAATLVVIEHAAYVANDHSWANSYFIYGRIGVVLFFAISGFVIALQRHRPVGVFVLHRLLRIYPGYWLAMAVAALMLAAAGREVGANAASLLLYPQVDVGDGSLQIPYWTLVYEMTFYALASAAFACRLSDRTLTVLALAWIVAVNLFAANPADAHAYRFPGASILLSAAVQVFPIGLLCGIHFARLRRVPRIAWLLLSAAVFAAGAAFPELTVTKIMLQGISAACILMALAEIRVRSRAVMALGDASYGIYLLHYPTLVAVTAFGLAPGFPALLAIGMAFGTAFGLLEHSIYHRLVAAARRAGVPPLLRRAAIDRS